MSTFVKGSGGAVENLEVPLTDLETTLQEVLNILPFKGAMVEGQYVWKKLTAEGGNFVSFVSSDDASAFPDGSMKDGYWYELVEEGVNFPPLAGCTKMAVDKITYSSRTAGGSLISHSLGGVPKVAILFCTSRSIVNFDVTASIVVRASSGSKCYGVSIYGYASDGTALNSTALSNDTSIMSATGVKAIMNNSIYYTAGVEYTLITMA